MTDEEKTLLLEIAGLKSRLAKAYTFLDEERKLRLSRVAETGQILGSVCTNAGLPRSTFSTNMEKLLDTIKTHTNDSRVLMHMIDIMKRQDALQLLLQRLQDD